MPAHHARRAAGALLTAAALALGACGGDDGDSTQEFVDASNKVTAEVSALGQDIGTTVTAAGEQTDAALQTQFSELATRAGDAVEGLDALEAPDDEVGGTVDALSTALTKGQKDLENIATAAGSSDAEGARTATQALVADSPAISEANTKLKEQTAALQSDE